METKKCTQCGEVKLVSEYYSGRNECKECKSKKDKVYREANRDKRNKQKREHYLKNAERLRAVRRDYVDKNRDEVNAKQREALDKKIEENPDFYKDYYNRNKERICDYTEKKRREAGALTRKEAGRIHSEKMMGDNNPNWKGGVTETYHGIRSSSEYSEWRRKCMIRDGFTCQITGVKGGKLNVHHITPYTELIDGLCLATFRNAESLFDTDNGITLSEDVHNEFHNIYGKKGFTEIDFIEFVRNKLFKNGCSN